MGDMCKYNRNKGALEDLVVLYMELPKLLTDNLLDYFSTVIPSVFNIIHK